MAVEKKTAEAVKEWLGKNRLSIDDVVEAARKAVRSPDSTHYRNTALVTNLTFIRGGHSPRLGTMRDLAEFLSSLAPDAKNEALYEALHVPLNPEQAAIKAASATAGPWEKLFDARLEITPQELDGLWDDASQKAGIKISVGMRRLGHTPGDAPKLMDLMGLDRKADEKLRMNLAPKLRAYMQGKAAPELFEGELRKIGEGLQFTPKQTKEFRSHYALDREMARKSLSPGRKRKIPESPNTTITDAQPEGTRATEKPTPSKGAA